MKYEWRIVHKDSIHKIYHLELWKENHNPEYGMYQVTAVRYQAWAFGACSMAAVWKWDRIPADTGMLAMFLRDALLPMHDNQDWKCERIFCQVPAAGKYNEWDEQQEIPFFKLLRETIFPDTQPIYTFENLSHKSTEQRLFDLPIEPMRRWMENYYASKEIPNVRTDDSSNGTIIAESEQIDIPF